MDKWRIGVKLVCVSFTHGGMPVSEGDGGRGVFYGLAGVFDRERDAHLLAGFLVGTESVRTVSVWSINPRGDAGCRFNWRASDGDTYWDTAAGEWEAAAAHVATIELWLRDKVAERTQGVQQWAVDWVDREDGVYRSMGLHVAIPVSSAPSADDGPSAEPPGTLIV